ncbi:hypothetical protein BH11PLA2_BH11PLA2_12480 [soil metagenome]
MIPPRETWHFDTRHVGQRVLVYDSLPSTNDLAFEINEPGTVIVAETQTAGRGQQGRVWQSRPGCSLLMSVIVAPPPELNRAVVLIAWAAVAISDAILSLTGQQARIKWPNDLLLKGRKVCGILTEQQRSTVVGIGLNLNQTHADFEQAELPQATSLALATGGNIEATAALSMVLRKLDAEYDRLLAGEQVPLESDWKWRVGLLGRHVHLELMDGSSLSGRLRDMSFEGIEIDSADGPATVIAPERLRQMRPA